MYLTIKESKNCKARLLYYFPKKEEEKDESKSEDDWCGWNLDHGTLTGLTCSMMVNEKGEECITNDKRPGLYIKNRKGETIKASWPTDTLHFKWENHVKFIQGQLPIVLGEHLKKVLEEHNLQYLCNQHVM